MPFKNKDEQRAAARKYANKNKLANNQRCKDSKLKIKIWFFKFKQTKQCMVCGEKHPACLDFHHKEGEKKIECVSVLVASGHSLKKIQAEIEKCDVLCANCHRKLHAEDRNVEEMLSKGQLLECKEAIITWMNKQGHDRCWYYPDIFKKLCNILEIKPTILPCLPPLEEFKRGCEAYQKENYIL